MALVFIPGTAPQYQALKSDMTSGSTIPGASYIGADLWFSDTNEWYRVTASMVLVPIYSSASPVATVAVSSISGSVTVGGTVAVSSVSGSTIVVNPTPTIDANFHGQINVSSSTVAVSGSTLSATNRNGFVLKAHPSNSPVIAWVYSNFGSLSGSSGAWPLSVGESMLFAGSSLAQLNYAITGGTSGCICWMRL